MKHPTQNRLRSVSQDMPAAPFLRHAAPRLPARDWPAAANPSSAGCGAAAGLAGDGASADGYPADGYNRALPQPSLRRPA